MRCILVLTTVPVRIRPRMETMPVKGHFLSVESKVLDGVLDSLNFPDVIALPHASRLLQICYIMMRTNVFALDCRSWRPEA